MGKLKNIQIDLESEFVPTRATEENAAIVRSLELYIHDIAGLKVLLNASVNRDVRISAVEMIDDLTAEVQAVIDWAPDTLRNNREEN
jgi:hypothetical protein